MIFSIVTERVLYFFSLKLNSVTFFLSHLNRMQRYGDLEYYEFGKYDVPMAGNDAIRDESLAIVKEIRKRINRNTLRNSGEAMLLSYVLSLTSRCAVRRRDPTLNECMRGYHMLHDAKKMEEMVNVMLRFAGYTETRNVERLDLPIVHFLRSRHLRRPVIILEKLADEKHLMNRPFRYLFDWERDARKQQEVLNQMVKVRHERSIDGRALSYFRTKNGEAFVREDDVEVIDEDKEETGLRRVSAVETESMVIKPSIEYVKGDGPPTLSGVYGAYYGSMLRWEDTETMSTLGDDKTMARVIVTSGSVVVGRLLTEINKEGISHGLVPISELEKLFEKGIILCPTPWRPVMQNVVVPFNQHEEMQVRNYWSRFKPVSGAVYWLARKEHHGSVTRNLFSCFDPVTVRMESSFEVKEKSMEYERDYESEGDGSVVVLQIRTSSNIYEKPREFFVRREFGDFLQRLKGLYTGIFVAILDQPFGEGLANKMEEKLMGGLMERRKGKSEREDIMVLYAELFRYILFELEGAWRSPWNVWAFLLKFAVTSEYYFDFVDLGSKLISSIMESMKFHYDSMYNDILIHVDGMKREYMILYSTFNMLEDKVKGGDFTEGSISRIVKGNFSVFHKMVWRIIRDFSVNASPSIPLRKMVQSFHSDVVFTYAASVYIDRMKKGEMGVVYERGTKQVVHYLEKMG